MKSQHTPGPWKVVSQSFPGCYHAVSENGQFSTGCISFDGHGLANARLIAAAPELLESLRVLLALYVRLANSGDCGNWNPEDEPEVIAARAALALCGDQE